MRTSEIQVGKTYHDGKFGVRQVIRTIDDPTAGEQVEYTLLAAKVEQEYDYRQGAMVSTIGTTGKCTLQSFASWAKTLVDDDRKQDLLDELTASRSKLAPGEAELMRFIADSPVATHGVAQAGAVLALPSDHGWSRSIKSLAKKGLLDPSEPDEFIRLTGVGAAYVRQICAESVADLEEPAIRPRNG